MSGGAFDYDQSSIFRIAEKVNDYINGHELDDEDIQYLDSPYRFIEEEEYNYCKTHHHSMPNNYGFSEETIAEFKKGYELLMKAYVYAQRIDWLLSGDDGEESFHERLKEDLENWNNKD